MINYILTAFACYLGIIGGFILNYFSKEELKKVRKKQFWFVKKSEIFYTVLAIIFYLTKDYEFFDSVASSIFIYGVVVGALDNDREFIILIKNLIFLILIASLLLLKP